MTRGSHRFLAVGLGTLVAFVGGISGAAAQRSAPAPNLVQGKEHYVMRDGLRIYLWEKYKEGNEESFSRTGKVALLVHGGAWSGRPDFDLQIRDCGKL